MTLANVYNKRQKSFVRDENMSKSCNFEKKEFDWKAAQKICSFKSSFRISCLSCQQVKNLSKSYESNGEFEKRIGSQSCAFRKKENWIIGKTKQRLN